MRTFFQLTEEDLGFVLEEKRIGLTKEEREIVLSLLKRKFEMPWFEYLSDFIDFYFSEK